MRKWRQPETCCGNTSRSSPFGPLIRRFPAGRAGIVQRCPPCRPQGILKSSKSARACRGVPMARFYAFGPFRLDARSDTLVGPQGTVALGQRACVLLRTLVGQPGVLVTKSQLMDAAWPGLAVEEGNLTVQISALRKTLGETRGRGQWIGTVSGRGYRFIGEVQESDAPVATRINDFSSIGPANADL